MKELGTELLTQSNYMEYSNVVSYFMELVSITLGIVVILLVVWKIEKKSYIKVMEALRKFFMRVLNILEYDSGRTPKPGEISLAHHGVLFLDELPEFKRDVLEVLRQPLEDGFVTIARVKETIVYPSRFMLVAAMNPCPCGWYGDPVYPCSCSIYDIKRYRSKISGPLWDRFDVQIEVPRLLPEELAAQSNGERSSKIRERVIDARNIQLKRYNGTGIFSNAGLTPHLMKKFIKIGEEERSFLISAAGKLGVTGRGYDRILRVARTIADLDHDEEIKLNHIAEALQYRIDLSVL